MAHGEEAHLATRAVDVVRRAGVTKIDHGEGGHDWTAYAGCVRERARVVGAQHAGGATVSRVIEVFADVCCPFTHVGLRRIVQRRADLGAVERLRLRVHAWPLEVVNGSPLDAAVIDEEVDAIRDQVAPDLFSGFDASQFPSTSVPAMALADAAYAVDLATGEAVSLALRDALFEHGRNIADPDVLADVARAHALAPPSPEPDTAAVLADWEAGRARGVIGSPHFFGARGDVFCPSLNIRRVDGHLVIDADPQAIDAFLDACVTG
jgi:2-hydroxychromene-2-carboxylate isomerase